MGSTMEVVGLPKTLSHLIFWDKKNILKLLVISLINKLFTLKISKNIYFLIGNLV